MDIRYKNEFQFLDLSGLNDKDVVEINVALNSGAAIEVLQLPWDTGETDYYEADVSLDPDGSQTWQNYESHVNIITDMISETLPTVLNYSLFEDTVRPRALLSLGTEHPGHCYSPPFASQANESEASDAEQSQAPYEGEIDTPGGRVISTMQSAPVYQPPQIMTAVYPRMVLAQPNIYVNEMVPEVNMHPYVDYQQPIYLQRSELHDGAINRDNRRRNHRVRGTKRDTNNRYMDPNNEMTSAYHSQQAQYHPMPRNICSPTVYFQTEPPNYSQPLPHPGYTQVCQHTGVGNQSYTRHTSMAQTPRQRQEIPKHSVKRVNEPTPRPTASTYGPPPLSIQRKTEAVNTSQTNIDCVTTVIVNNSKSEHSVNNEASECTATTTQYSSNNNKNIHNSDSSSSSNSSNNNNNNKVPPVNVTIEHNIVATVNKNCELSEKTDVPFVNINSSIQVKQKTENNVELRKETVSLVQTSSPALEPESVTTKDETKEEIVQSNVQDTVVEKKEPDSSTPQLPITPTTRAAPESSMSWASILKKSSNESSVSGITNGKPTARINPLRIEVASDTEVSPKLNFSPNEAPGTRQLQRKPRAFTTTDNSGNESTASNRTEPQEEYNSSNKFDDLDAHKTGEFLSKYQMDKQTVSLLPRGLINRNNYCYINSILQALLACPPFYNLLKALPYSKNTSRNNTSNNLTTNMIRFVHEFSPLSAGARLGRKDLRAQKRSDEVVVNIQSGIAFEPSYVYTMLKNTSCSSVFSVEGRQEDAEEFLSCLLNGISDEMLEMMKLANNENTSTATENEPIQANHGGEQEEWKIMGPKNKGSITRCTDFGRTPLSDIFRGQLRYRVSRAGEQSMTTDNVQPFFTLQLDIEKAESVKGALEILVGKDQLEGMTCSKTKREIEAWKQVTLEELPVILILHLKWFDYKLDGCSKILKSVEFPIDLKIDSKILSQNTAKKLSLKQKQYKLFAVTYHDGKEATKGHYVTDAFHVGYGGWVRYDDSSLRGVSEHNVLNPSPPRVPYLLYYRRCDTIGNNQLNSDRIR